MTNHEAALTNAPFLPPHRKFRKKPVVIEAVQWTGSNIVDVSDFTKGAATFDGRWRYCEIATLEGTLIASPRDWIIRGVKGEFYPCKPDIFEATYDAVEPQTGSESGEKAAGEETI